MTPVAARAVQEVDTAVLLPQFTASAQAAGELAAPQLRVWAVSGRLFIPLPNSVR